VPDIGELLVYHAAGHKAARRVDEHISGMACGRDPAAAPSLLEGHGRNGSVKGTPSDDAAVLAVRVARVSYHPAGGVNPYCRVVLETCAAGPAPALQAAAAKLRARAVAAAPGARLAHLLAVAPLAAAAAHADSAHFAHSVSVKQFPDYAEVVASPMHLEELAARAAAMKYATAAEFMEVSRSLFISLARVVMFWLFFAERLRGCAAARLSGCAAARRGAFCALAALPAPWLLYLRTAWCPSAQLPLRRCCRC